MSSGAATATVSIPSARHVRNTRSAISPLFATSSRRIDTGRTLRRRRYRLRAVIRFLVRTAIVLIGNAVGLIVASLVLDGFSINFASFVVAVVIFTIVFAVLQPFLAVQLRRLGNGAIGATALIATLVSLFLTDLLSDGLEIDGVGTWIAAAVIVWLAALVAAFVLPFLGLKKYLDERRD